MTVLVVQVSGADRPGIVAAVTRALADLGANLEDSAMNLLRGHFAISLVLAAPVPADAVAAALAPVARSLGLTVSVHEVADDHDRYAAGEQYVLTVHGADRPGIVAAMAGAVAEQGGNVTDLRTLLTGSMYVLVAELELPEGLDVAVLSAELDRRAATLGVEVGLRPADADVL